MFHCAKQFNSMACQIWDSASPIKSPDDTIVDLRYGVPGANGKTAPFEHHPNVAGIAPLK